MENDLPHNGQSDEMDDTLVWMQDTLLTEIIGKNDPAALAKMLTGYGMPAVGHDTEPAQWIIDAVREAKNGRGMSEAAITSLRHIAVQLAHQLSHPITSSHSLLSVTLTESTEISGEITKVADQLSIVFQALWPEHTDTAQRLLASSQQSESWNGFEITQAMINDTKQILQ